MAARSSRPLSTSTALSKRPSPAETALMAPPPPPKRIKRPQKVLDEDTYTSALSHIIARDFFPGLLESESTHDYLDALDAGDDEWIDEAEKKVREVMSTPRYGRGRRGVAMTPLRGLAAETPRVWPGDTPKSTAHATPASTPSSRRATTTSQSKQDEDDVDLSLGLTAFQAKYTSEDNESFNKVLDKQNTKRAETYKWMWNGNKIPSARQIAQAARDQKLLRDAERAAHTPTNHDRESQSQAVVLRPSQDLDTRPAGIATQPTAQPRNNLMFHAADDITSTHPHLTTVAAAAQARSKAPPKSVSYTSTRLQTALNAATDTTDPPVPESPSLSAIDAAIAGHPHHRPASTLAPSEAASGSETPRVNGYSYVDAEPTPSELGIPPSPPPRGRTDLLTALLESSSDAAATGPNPFTIHASSKREALHHRIVDKHLAAKRAPSSSVPPAASHPTPSATSRRTAAAAAAPTPTPRFSSAPKKPPGAATPRAAPALTPAAQQLYNRVGRTPVRAVGGGGAFDYSAAVGRAQREGERERRKRARGASASVTPVARTGVES